MSRTLAFFSAATASTGQELWETDGTAAGTMLVADIVPGAGGSYPGNTGFVPLGRKLVVFGARDSRTGAPEPFASDGTTAGTVELSTAFVNLTNSYIFSTSPPPDPYIPLLRDFTQLGDGRMLFTGATSPNSLQLWSTDGTAAGTGLVKDLVGSDTSITDIAITPIGRGKALFTVSFGADAVLGLWGTDGTPGGTVHLSTYTGVFAPLGDGRALVLISTSASTDTLGITDGTLAGTTTLRTFTQYSRAAPIGNGRAVFAASDGSGGPGLWVTDGTAAGTVLVLQGPAPDPRHQTGLTPTGFTPLGDGRFVFIGDDGTCANTMYVTDGTAAGTGVLAELGPVDAPRTFLLSATSLGNGRVAMQTVDYTASTTAVLVTDGTAAGTAVACTFALAPSGGSQALSLAGDTAVLGNGTAVFSVADSPSKLKLWRTDGTVAGTSEFAAVDRATSSTPQLAALSDGRAVFRIGNPDGTATLWSTNGTAAGTAAIPGVSVGSNLSGAFGVATVADLDPLFDTDWYNTRNPDVTAAGINAYQHFLTNGGREGRAPDPFFDSALYLRQNPDVAASGMNPLTHFEQFGWHEGRDPSLLFSVSKYLAANPDVAAAEIDPLEHYLRFGQAESRPTYLSGGVRGVDPLVSASFYDAQLGATLIPPGGGAVQQAAYLYDATGWQRGLNPDPFFGTSYYLAHNADVAAAHVNPLTHYEQYGWKEGRDPSATFSTGKYLAANPDVAAAGVNPLLHYVQYGQAEGRAIYPA